MCCYWLVSFRRACNSFKEKDGAFSSRLKQQMDFCLLILQKSICPMCPYWLLGISRSKFSYPSTKSLMHKVELLVYTILRNGICNWLPIYQTWFDVCSKCPLFRFFLYMSHQSPFTVMKYYSVITNASKTKYIRHVLDWKMCVLRVMGVIKRDERKNYKCNKQWTNCLLF